jgi:hypothetical protein
MPIKPFPAFENIQAIPIPLPVETQLITINLYFIGKGPITLIDTGPKAPGLLEFVGEQLNAAGFGFEDIERIIVTHGHVDHTGLTAEIRNAAGNSVDFYIHPEDSWLISEERHQEFMWSKESDFLTELAGIPAGDVEKIKKRFAYFKELCDMDLIWKGLKKAPRSIFRLIEDVFPVVPEGDIFLAVSEIAVHLEVLINEGRAELVDQGPPALFQAI